MNVTANPSHSTEDVRDDRPWIVTAYSEGKGPRPGTVTLHFDTWQESAVTPITPDMPRWLLREGAIFQTTIPMRCQRRQSLEGVVWGSFSRLRNSYLSESQLFDSLTVLLHGKDPVTARRMRRRRLLTWGRRRPRSASRASRASHAPRERAFERNMSRWVAGIDA